MTFSRGWLLAGAGLLLGVVGGWVVGLLRSPAVSDAVADVVPDVGSAP